jgi:hypothetical protein
VLTTFDLDDKTFQAVNAGAFVITCVYARFILLADSPLERLS